MAFLSFHFLPFTFSTPSSFSLEIVSSATSSFFLRQFHLASVSLLYVAHSETQRVPQPTGG